ncbi:FprA family A-type flavoprotein [Plasticicumulans acidivorans]|uniref:Flavorubredoxin n=1 Tax=Plasticicumulans acidivorans TaxID=886464 RepID=A0A317MQG8_9GAMM|nr:FprA family A-type flavoprotein [Plasticicumulans acidivorans]PWV58626.1 flavorubredoxin [Plasticicumulans acidivorans]
MISPASAIPDGEAVELAPGVHWVGAFDPSLRRFDLILSTANGTSYNAYAVRGSEGVVVVDTVKSEFADVFFARLETICDYSEIRAIVLNHLEPDHSGALPELLRRAPQAEVLLSTRAQSMLKAVTKADGVEYSYRPVATGDTLSLGDRTLRFISTPFLHWPDTQCTYLEELSVLFSGDVFGCHFCDQRLFNDRVGDFRYAFEYYYRHIMRPFRSHVIEALDLLEPLELALIAPAHGPVLRDGPRDYVDRYRTLAQPTLQAETCAGEKTLLIFYLSAYGNTERMAQAVYAGAEGVEGCRVSLFDLEGSEPSLFVDLIEEADGFVIGSPTINGDAVKPAWDLLSSLTLVKLRGKLGGAFGSYGWSGEAVQMLEDRLRGLKLVVPRHGPKVKLIPTEEELDECRAFGRALAEHLTGVANQARVVDFADLIRP